MAFIVSKQLTNRKKVMSLPNSVIGGKADLKTEANPLFFVRDQRSTAMPNVEQTGSDRTPIRPFKVNVPEAELTELRRRINATRWPERELVNDISQGVQLATMQKLARYWATEYDWRRCEAQQ